MLRKDRRIIRSQFWMMRNTAPQKSGSKDFSKALDTIKEQATTITDNLNSYDWVGTEGTVLRYLRRVKTTQQADGNLDIESECMKALVYPAESGDGVYEEYFYWGREVILCIYLV